jgi:hypothetical protein
MNEIQLLQRRALLHAQAAFLLRKDADRPESEARLLRDEAERLEKITK